MVQAAGLKERVISYVDAAGETGVFSDAAQQALTDAKALFELAPDEYIDVGRLPTSVFNLPTLVDYLKTIKQKLENRDNKVENKDWDVAKSGELRLYKLFVCNIHALESYINSGNVDYAVNPTTFASAACTYGKTNPPKGLSEKGSTMWNKTYGDSQPRTQATMRALVFLCRKTIAKPDEDPPPEEDQKSVGAEDEVMA